MPSPRFVAGAVSRVVLDTNVLISAVLFGGEPGRVVEAAREGVLAGVTSLYILNEFRTVLTSPKFGIPVETAEAMALEIAGFTEVFAVEMATRSWVDDPDDDPLVETALLAEATHIVTGDRALLRTSIPGVRVVTVEALLRSLDGL
ncbi:MAG: putative toxin-antitoxin system toxin component, PIN family [Thermoleophilia bacterium]